MVSHMRRAGVAVGVLTSTVLNMSTATAQTEQSLDQLEIIGTTPLPGANVPRSAIPANVQTIQGDEIDEQRSGTLAEHFNSNFTGVYINEAQSNPYQPDLNYRGFVASPLLGNPIGLSVYVDGVRVNESFGDTVLWDLIPSAAIARTDLVPGSNPVFGLNTLGGALNVRTRSGASSPGGQVLLETGSFGRRGAQARYGLNTGKIDFFISGEVKKEDGRRDRSPTDIRRVFTKLGVAGENTDFWVSYTHAENKLTGNGLMPLSLLASEPDSVYTYPDESEPSLSFINSNLSHYLNDELTLTASLYRRSLDLKTANGDAEFDDDEGEYEAEFRRTETNQTTTGAGLQLASDGSIGERRNRWAVGINLDRGKSRFQQSEQEGEFTDDRGIEGEGALEIDTDIDGRTSYEGIYLTDTLSITDRFDLTLSGRYTRARVEIADRTGDEPDLNGDHSFSRFTPSIGATYKLGGNTTIFGGYNEGFRAPTPVELTCADPNDPCALPVAFVADPPLDPVIARTVELGVRSGSANGMNWNAGFFQSNLKDDILFTSTGASQGFFANVPKTQRQGLEIGASSKGSSIDWFANYSYTRATYQSDVQLFNPVANENDPSQPETQAVEKGDKLPGVPDHLLKAGIKYKSGKRWSVGSTVNVVGGQFIRGDEANNQKELSGYALFNLNADYSFQSGWRLFAKVNNLFDKDYATLGALNRIAFENGNEARDELGPVERFVSPGAPRSFWVGVEYRFGAR